MSASSSSEHQVILDDPEKTTGIITIGAAAVFGVLHEVVPVQYRDVVKVLGAADTALNLSVWVRLHKQSLMLPGRAEASMTTLDTSSDTEIV